VEGYEVLVPTMRAHRAVFPVVSLPTPKTWLWCGISDTTEVTISVAAEQLTLLEKHKFIGTTEDMQHHCLSSMLSYQKVKQRKNINQKFY